MLWPHRERAARSRTVLIQHLVFSLTAGRGWPCGGGAYYPWLRRHLQQKDSGTTERAREDTQKDAEAAGRLAPLGRPGTSRCSRQFTTREAFQDVAIAFDEGVAALSTAHFATVVGCAAETDGRRARHEVQGAPGRGGPTRAV
ncbi:unnamed protein product [Prorocentrum cordatum]|uniref:Uncharacterized protein n=1 Tax=Prorocentrum cordatum TaxID=2364126 RepID=A0ABN9WPZ6_9DINO|nr:unnamed protein product [Polarella glacialis]